VLKLDVGNELIMEEDVDIEETDDVMRLYILEVYLKV
jgi:hypothetical protein